MRRPLVISGAIAALMWLGGCSADDRKADAVPRPMAYPRVAALDSVYFISDSTAVRFDVNASATLSVKSPYWFDIKYPAYSATVFVTVTKTTADSVAAVIDNRRERVMLNVGDVAAVTMVPCNSDEFTSYIYRSPSVRSTPLQFISTDGHSTVVSGAVFFGDVAPDAPVDSLAPMVAQIQRDITRSLDNLSAKNKQ